MALTEQQKRQVEINLRTLDYLEGTGILNNMKKHLSKERFLFISSGGTGHKLMKVIKENLLHHVVDEDIKSRVAFLVIDTDHGQLDKLKKEKDKGVFEGNELIKLPYQEARRTIAPSTITPQVEAWVHPELYDVTGGEGTSAEFSGIGAGAYRQVGRVHLAQRTALEILKSQVVGKVRMLVSDKSNLERVNVFFLCGISGGTGSGTIIDLAFLTRHFIKEFNEQIYARTRFRAYLMLPSACGFETDSGKKSRGNRNAYAALKEIDYFMNLSVRQEHYQEYYDGVRVDLKDNIFDFCTLVEGVGGPGIIFKEQNKVAMTVTADSIVNMITDTGLKDGSGSTQFLVDSFLCNRDVTSDIIRAHSHREWPRNAHYVYNVIGYSECVVPIDLMVAYVSIKIFDQVWALFIKNGNITEKQIDDFLYNCELDAKSLRGMNNFLTLKENIRIEIGKQFEQNGPYYVVNLLADSIKRIQEEEGMYRKEAIKKAKTFLAINKEKWEKTVIRYDRVVDEVLRPWNQEIFDVYTYAIDIFRELLDKNAGILTETIRYETVFGNSYCWSPIDLSKGREACESVRDYLESLISEEEAEKKAKKFVRNLIDKQEEWTDLSSAKRIGRFNAAREVREFMEKEVYNVINTTLEGFLVKLYSGTSDATVVTINAEGKEVPHPAVMEAASEIVDRLENEAAALAQSRYLEESYRYLYITIPKGCQWLKKAIEEKCSNKNVQVYESSAQDRIVLYRLYSGIAAYMLTWVKQAEEDYEADVNYPGLHISQSKTGKDWTRFPNLYVEPLWSDEERRYREREAKISQREKKAMEEAQQLGMIRQDENGGYYALLPIQGTVVEQLTEAIELSGDFYEPEKVMENLERVGIIEAVKLKYTGMIVATTENPKPKDFDWQMALQAVRMNVPLMERIIDGLGMIEKVIQYVKDHNQKVEKAMLMKARMGCLIDMWMFGFLSYDELRERWILELPLQDQRELVKLNGRLAVECKEYYCAEVFFDLEETLYEECAEAVQSWKNQSEDRELIERKECQKKLKDRLFDIRWAKKRKEDISYPMASTDFVEEAGNETADRIRKFYDRLISEI